MQPLAATAGDTIATSCVPPAQLFDAPSVHVNVNVVAAPEAGFDAVTAVGASLGVLVVMDTPAVGTTAAAALRARSFAAHHTV